MRDNPRYMYRGLHKRPNRQSNPAIFLQAIDPSMMLRRSRSLLIGLVLAATINGVATAADQVKQLDLGNAKLSYTEKRMWFSLPWGGPKFTRLLSLEYEGHGSRLETHLKAAGLETGSTSGIRLEIIEDYAGRLADYRRPTVTVYDGPKANGLQVAGALAITALLSRFGFFSPGQVGIASAANTANSTVNSIGQTMAPPNARNPANQAVPEKMQESPNDDLLVVLRVCSAGSQQCIETAAISSAPMSLDELRNISIDEGVTRALGLPAGPIAATGS
jgi:hypothetical protein